MRCSMAAAPVDRWKVRASAKCRASPRPKAPPIPRLYGRARLGGELIWATRFEEVANVSRAGGGGVGGKGGLMGGGGGGSGAQTTTTYAYFANIAIGLCEGPIAFVRRIWADGRLLDVTNIAMRVHAGGEFQQADPLIVAKERAENAPAYRGTAYVVFERLALADFGNRIPQFAFEVVRPVGALNARIRGVNLIPGAGELAYASSPVFRDAGFGESTPENVNQLTRSTEICRLARPASGAVSEFRERNAHRHLVSATICAWVRAGSFPRSRSRRSRRSPRHGASPAFSGVRPNSCRWLKAARPMAERRPTRRSSTPSWRSGRAG